MINITNKKDCCGCYSCYNACPRDCINMVYDDEGFIYPKINLSLCIDCGLCEKVCLMSHPFKHKLPQKVYASKVTNLHTRLKSSSGGVFSALAEQVIQNNGIVFGARLTDHHKCIHGWADNLEDYKEFRGSKYIQSTIGKQYSEVKNFLKKDKLVLFTGCPCQVSGLKHFLQRHYENLICVDLICHGVPSQKIFDLYLEYIESKYGSKLHFYSFRTKEKRWKMMPFSFTLANGKKHILYHDKYCKGFTQNLFLRPSCYSCMANNFRSGSDLTIADYWGVETKFPKFNDEFGISLVLANTKIGCNILDEINVTISSILSDLKHAEKFQPNLKKSSIPHKDRTKFFKDLAYGYDFKYLSKKYLKTSLIDRGKIFVSPYILSYLKIFYYKLKYNHK